MRGPILTLALTVLVASCGGSEPIESATTPASGVDGGSPEFGELLDSHTVELIEDFVDDLGPGEAFAAVLFALDDGYDAGQINDALSDGTLGADGSIGGVDAARPPAHRILRTGPSASGDLVVLAAGPNLALGPQVAETPEAINCAALVQLSLADSSDCDPFANDAFRPPSRDEAIKTITLLVMLTGAGYSVDQIVGDLLLDPEGASLAGVFDFIPLNNGNANCPVIDDRGTPVIPEYPSTLDVFEGCDAQYARVIQSTAETTTTAASQATEAVTDQDQAGEGDLTAHCSLYGTFLDEFDTRFDAFLDEGLSEDGDADPIEAAAAAFFQDLFKQMLEVAPGEVRADVALLADQGFANLWSDEGFSDTQLDALFSVDDHAAAACGHSLDDLGD